MPRHYIRNNQEMRYRCFIEDMDYNTYTFIIRNPPPDLPLTDNYPPASLPPHIITHGDSGAPIYIDILGTSYIAGLINSFTPQGTSHVRCIHPKSRRIDELHADINLKGWKNSLDILKDNTNSQFNQINFEHFKKIIEHLGGTVTNAGKTSGSKMKFELNNHSITIDKPHGASKMKGKISKFKQFLRDCKVDGFPEK